MEQIKTLIICEKPDAAGRVARAIDENGSPRRRDARGVPFFECARKNDTVIVCSALGHLYSIDSKSRGSRQWYPVWDCTWKPKHEIEKKSARLANWIDVIKSVSKDVDQFVNACDIDVEGSLIGLSILQYACHGAHLGARRMTFSTMTEKELKTAFSNMMPRLDFATAEAGRCRHELDWLYGINLSRLLTQASLKQGRGYATLSTGRVQGPTLGFVVAREEEIEFFVPSPFWLIDASIKHDGRIFQIEYAEDRVPTLEQADRIVRECNGQLLEVSNVETRHNRQSPPFPFDLSSLQAEAYRHFGYSPSRTLAIAEKLYLEALISYPRTSSQKLPPDIGYVEILKGIESRRNYAGLVRTVIGAGGLRPIQGPKEDPAHPAIYPTGQPTTRPLSGQEEKLLDIIVRRFLAAFAKDCLRLSSTIILTTGSHRFFLRGSQILEPGWTEFYQPYVRQESQEVPPLSVGEKVPLHSIRSLEKFTQPPPRFNPGSLLRKMEEENIGTKATRAEIIEILYRRGYIKETRIRTTPLAVLVTELLRKYCPLIVDPGFTAKIETLMDGIQQGSMIRRHVLVESLSYLRPAMLELMEREQDLGAGLSEVVVAQRVAELTFDSACPQCGSVLKIVRNRKSGKRFVGCSGKWEKGCGYSLPLPQFGTISLLRRKCKVCGFQMIQARSRGRRPLVSCPRCYAQKVNSSTLKGIRPKATEVQSGAVTRAM